MSSVVNPFTGQWVMEPKPQNVWGIPHSVWFFAMGVGGALFINRALFGIELGRVLGLVLADVLSLVFIGIGGLILIADLGKPYRLLRALLNPRTSWISVGAICDFVFLVFGGLWVIADLDLGGARPFAGLPWAGDSALGIAFQLLAGAAAFVVVVYPGLVLSYSPSIPFWNTMLVPLQFLAFAFSSALGLGLFFAILAPADPGAVRAWAVGEAFLLVVSLILVLAHLLNGTSSHTAARVSVQRLVKGDLRLPFLWGTIALGLLVPVVLILSITVLGRPESNLVYLALAGLITLPGNWLSKYSVIRAGTYAPFL